MAVVRLLDFGVGGLVPKSFDAPASWSKGLRLGRRVCVLVEGSVSWSWGRVFVAGVSLFVAWSVRPVITGKDRNRDLEI